MFQATVRRALFGVTLVAAVGFVAGSMGCGGSGTDGTAGPGDFLVDDGGSGASLRITIEDREIGVGDRTAFFVEMLDPRGAPLSHVRVFCESELGIAIIEPSSGGVAFEHTNANGRMSGVLGGLAPGSYLLECRAQEGFNLVDRQSMLINGPVPVGFAGFPGAAGGNLGGGVIVDVTPDTDEGLRFTAQFQDAGGASTAGPIDLFQDGNCDDDATTIDPEPFEFVYYILTITNGTTLDLTVDSVQIAVDQAGAGADASLPAQAFNQFIPAGGSTTVQGLFFQSNTAGPTPFVFAGTTVVPVIGSHRATIEVGGTLEDGSDVTIRQTVTVNFDNVNNCSS